MTERPLVIKSCLFDEFFMRCDTVIQMNPETGQGVRFGQSMEMQLIFWFPDHLHFDCASPANCDSQLV